MRSHARVTREELAHRLRKERPSRSDRRRGYVLIHVLDREAFEREHIPGSVHIPAGREDEIEKRYDRCKLVIVYGDEAGGEVCAGVADALAERGFVQVQALTGGMQAWRGGGMPVASGRGADRGHPDAPDRPGLSRM